MLEISKRECDYVKKVYLIVSLFILAIISGCDNDIEDFVLDINIEDYTLIYSSDEYNIFEVSEYDDESIIAYRAIEYTQDLKCSILNIVDNHYVLEYKDYFLHINYGMNNDLYDARDLHEYGVDIHCRLLYDGEPENPPSSELVGTIAGIEFYRDTKSTCENDLGEVIIDGFDFGYISEGCDYTLNSIGYVAYTSNKVYNLEDVILSSRITIEDIHNLYMNDSDKIGTFDE